MSDRTLYFTYGTLKFGQRNDGALRKETFLGNAVTAEPKFMLYDIEGPGYSYAFPGLVERDTGVQVYGEAYLIVEEVVKWLDRIEGIDLSDPLFYKKQIPILTDRGESLQATAYCFARDTKGLNSCGQCWPKDAKELQRYHFIDKQLITKEGKYKLIHYQLQKDISPEFGNLSELCEWSAENTTIFGGEKISANQWKEMISNLCYHEDE